MPHPPSLPSMLAVLAAVLFGLPSSTLKAADPPSSQPADTLWVIPHTHWEGAVFKTREEYLQGGLYHILHALRLLDKYPQYTFVLDQVAYVRPFLERYPEQESTFKKFVEQGRLQLVLGMDVMPDDVKVGGESFIRQIQYGKRYYRDKLGVDVKIAWMLDTFGHHRQLPQLLKLAGYSSFWFFRGVPRQDFPSEFLWEGIDGTRIPAFWEPFGYGDFYGAPRTLPAFENYARQRFAALNTNARGHDRVVYSGADVSDPQDHVPPLLEQAAKGGRLGFNIRFGVPTEFESAVMRRTDLPVHKLDLNPIFQGTYSSRIELKQWMRRDEQLLLAAEKLAAIAQFLGHRPDPDAIWDGWEPMLFNETHDLASGVMTDHVYDDTIRSYQISENIAEQAIGKGWAQLARAANTGIGNGTPLIVFNTLSWPRTDVVDADWGFTAPDVKGITVTDSKGKIVPSQITIAGVNPDGTLRHARVAFVARDVPPMGYAVYHVQDQSSPAEAPNAPTDNSTLENDLYRLTFDPFTGAIKSIRVKQGDWEALRGPAVVARQDDHGDVWELYRGLDGGSRIAMTKPQPIPKRGTDKFSSDASDKTATIARGQVFCEFTVAHPFDDGKFTTTVRLTAGSPRIEISTRLTNQSKFVRYQALFPTTIKSGSQTQSIPFGAVERPEGIEFPAMEWSDYSDQKHGVSILNVGLPGNLVADGTLLLSLLRSQTLGAYGFGGGYEPGMSSDGGLEIGKERTLHYALMPHAGDWRDAQTWRQAAEFANPLIARKAGPHPGSLPPVWSFLTVTSDNAAVTSIQTGREGATLIRLFEPTGRPAKNITLTLPGSIKSAEEVNLLDVTAQTLKPDGRTLHIDLAPFQIKTVSLQLEQAKLEP